MEGGGGAVPYAAFSRIFWRFEQLPRAAATWERHHVSGRNTRV